MKCQKCGVNNANTHVKSIINGEIKEYDLCSECAKKMGYTNVFSDIEDEFSNFLGSFFGNALPARTQARRCETCGSTYSEIAKTGHVAVPIAMMYLATNSSHLSEEFTATQHIAARTATERFRKPKSTNLQKKKKLLN